MSMGQLKDFRMEGQESENEEVSGGTNAAQHSEILFSE
jgi:hypothetical protein